MLSNLTAQQRPVKSIHELTMNDIQTFMAEQFDPKRFVVGERFKFWFDMKRKPGETIPELASRIQDAATCNFQSIKASPKLQTRKKRKPPASGVEFLDILAKLFAASARKQVICNLYACSTKSQSPMFCFTDLLIA